MHMRNYLQRVNCEEAVEEQDLYYYKLLLSFLSLFLQPAIMAVEICWADRASRSKEGCRLGLLDMLQI